MTIYEVKFEQLLPYYFVTLEQVRQKIAELEIIYLEYVNELTIEENDLTDIVVNWLANNSIYVNDITSQSKRIFL